jgi:DNA-binding NtrC family response regulator
MTELARLTPEDREFFALVARAVFLNPFSDERAEIDARLAGVESVAGLSEPERVRLFLSGVTERLEGLEQAGHAKTSSFSGEDRRLIEYAWLFHYFHHYLERFDGLIQTQLEQGDEPTRVDFARELLDSMRERGFTRLQSLRYLALFYQLRRAYYFIEKSLVGRSPSMKDLRLSLWNSVFTHNIAVYDRYLWNRMEDFSTLLLGETGTGKGTAAQAIGRSGYIPFRERRNAFAESFTQSFLAINLSQFPESLIESELFGHEKGAFTGAVESHEGVFARGSRHGALFLDEIGEVSVPVQIKLLQVLQERTFSPVGSHQRQRFEGRVIAATNRPLKTLRGPNGLRDDFFYRLSSDIITVPPLQQRIAEDPVELDELINLVVGRILGQTAPWVAATIRRAIERALPADYRWPGNVRELEQAVRRILLTGSYRGDEAAADPGELDALLQSVEAGAIDARELLSCYCRMLYQRLGSFAEVARKTKLDTRTVKKYVEQTDE